jgi:hypothetical protein
VQAYLIAKSNKGKNSTADFFSPCPLGTLLGDNSIKASFPTRVGKVLETLTNFYFSLERNIMQKNYLSVLNKYNFTTVETNITSRKLINITCNNCNHTELINMNSFQRRKIKCPNCDNSKSNKYIDFLKNNNLSSNDIITNSTKKFNIICDKCNNLELVSIKVLHNRKNKCLCCKKKNNKNDYKYNQIVLNLSDESFEKYSNLASEHNLKLTTFFYQVLEAKSFSTYNKNSLINDLTYELNMIGRNLNQIAKYINKKKNIDFNALSVLNNLENEINELSNYYLNKE